MMETNKIELLNSIVEKTDSVLVIFFILVILGGILILIPVYKLFSKNKADKNETEVTKLEKCIQRETQLLDIITKNTEVISEIKILFEVTIKNFSESNSNLNERFNVFDDKVDNITSTVNLLDSKFDKLVKK